MSISQKVAKGLAKAALHLAQAGHFILPLKGKQPLINGGYLNASNDPEQIRLWWIEFPGANIGLVPGLSGLIVLDIDGKEGYQNAKKLGVLDIATVTVTTGRDEFSMHVYFRHPGGTINNRSLCPGIDIRADKGYVVVPPSVHPVTGRTYQW